MRGLLVVALVLVACGDNIKPKGDGGMDGPMMLCGNGVVDGTEECDDGDGNGGPGARCETSCRWVCQADNWCADTNPCNGDETCVDHACVAGTDLADGTTCGTGKLCRNAACTDSVCGDSYTTAPSEECDDADSDPSNGCDNNCRFSCLSTDTARNCTPADPCAGQGTCNDNTHVCTPGTPLNDNTPCTTATITSGGYCRTAICTQAMCGNGLVEPGEVCDEGSANGTPNSGCKTNCQYVCVNATTDCPAAPFCQMRACSASHTCSPVADPAKDGMSCGTNLVCNNGACVPPSAMCGNGVTETGEQCDFGAGNGSGTGCETNCQFSCTILPDSCNDGNLCNGTETCTMVTVMGRPGQRCTATSAPPAGTGCGSGRICLGQVCVLSTCGDGFVNGAAGETCEPPNTATCDSACHTIVCGDSVRSGSEQCDDGNATNLDGCDSTCKFEQCHRVITLSMAFAPDTAFCPQNALGGAIVGTFAQGQVGMALTSGVNDGSITIDYKLLGLDDLSGTSDPAVLVGLLSGTPVAGAGYNGANDLDWWYTTAPTVIDAMRNPTTQVPGTIVAKILNAGPAEIIITVSLAGIPATLNMLDAKLRSTLGATSTPLTSAGTPPGHLAAEHLNPALVSFATASNGALCGNVTAQSLRTVPLPSALIQFCSAGYTANNSLLDVVVNGCNTLLGLQIRATQPDKARTPGDVYTFSVNATTKIVNACTKNGVPGVLTECLANAAYSSLFRFTTDRVIAK